MKRRTDSFLEHGSEIDPLDPRNSRNSRDGFSHFHPTVHGAVISMSFGRLDFLVKYPMERTRRIDGA
jgi:hypothetical protein